MRIKNLSLLFCAFIFATQFVMAEDCFPSKEQQYNYEKGIYLSENGKITACLAKKLDASNEKQFENVTASLRKSNNISAAAKELINIFTASQKPAITFTAATALISAPAETASYEDKIIKILTSQTAEDYKKTLAVIILTSMGRATNELVPFLTPSLNATDALLKAYGSAAYSILMPGGLNKYLDQIILLYSFDKTFAQKAFNATALTEKTLGDKLAESSKNQTELIRLSAIEWISDRADKKSLAALFDVAKKYNDAPTLAATANALFKNSGLLDAELKKILKKSPPDASSTAAVMAYALMGSKVYPYIEEIFKTGAPNEKANAFRILASIAGILVGNDFYYLNPALEKQMIKNFIPTTSRYAKSDKTDKQIKLYAETAAKELYKLINQ